MFSINCTAKKQMFLFFIAIFFSASCTPTARFNRDKVAFDNSKVVQKFKSLSEMNDMYFELRENNFFNYYRALFDLHQNTHYPGKYTMRGDTLLLKFYNKKGKELLGTKAFLDKQRNELVFFDSVPGSPKRWFMF